MAGQQVDMGYWNYTGSGRLFLERLLIFSPGRTGPSPLITTGGPSFSDLEFTVVTGRGGHQFKQPHRVFATSRVIKMHMAS
jgi:hypothetical protein